jgi:hypothetical protein
MAWSAHTHQELKHMPINSMMSIGCRMVHPEQRLALPLYTTCTQLSLLCRQLKREIDMLQRKIASLKRHAAAAAAGGTAAAGEAELALTAAAIAAADGDVPGAWPPGERHNAAAAAAAAAGSRGRGVAAAVARDRAIARLGLGIVEEYPRDVLVDLLQVRRASYEMQCLFKQGVAVVRCMCSPSSVADESRCNQIQRGAQLSSAPVSGSLCDMRLICHDRTLVSEVAPSAAAAAAAPEKKLVCGALAAKCHAAVYHNGLF